MRRTSIGVVYVLGGLAILAGCTTGSPGKGPSPTEPYNLVDGTYTGAVVENDRGPVQVQITVSGQRIVSVEALQTPTEAEKSVTINKTAIPKLNAAVIEAQSTYIDFVSGATMTSTSYVESLQDAIDQANQG